jgi:hypothetical protein
MKMRSALSRIVKVGLGAVAAMSLLWGPALGTPAVASPITAKAKPAHAKFSPAVRRALHQREHAIRSLRAQLKTARQQRSAALRAEARSENKVVDLQAKLDAATRSATSLQGQVTSLQGQVAAYPPQISALQAQINGMVGSLDQQIRVVSTPQAWSLLPALYSRFPTDPLADYSASFFQSGTYRSYTFTYSP